MMAAILKLSVVSLLVLLTCGCATTYVPVSWGFGKKVQELSRSDLTLATLFERYDPKRQTLRVGGDSFDEVMFPGEVKHHLGAYRPDTKLIYRNLYKDYNDRDLRDLMVHELAHHVWYNFMSPGQREMWRVHLSINPTPLQDMVRSVYSRPADYDTEDFAFTVEYPRPVDIEQLARLKIISDQERDAILDEQYLLQHRGAPRGSSSTPLLSIAAPQPTDKGPEPLK
jgi:hypothetical protein